MDERSATHDLGRLKPKPFLDTGLGGLAPEIREIIFINLLAVPPPFGGRDLRVERTSVVDQPPIALTSFVDLKASCLTVLQTCRQIYLEAYPLFYASKAYYIANSEDLLTFEKLDRSSFMRGRCPFMFDTITSICLKDLVIKMPTGSHKPVELLDTFVDSSLFGNMKSLRKICLCMRVGQELKYLQFLFRIEGLRRGVVNFVDNSHWTIRSQSILGDKWQLQYAYAQFSNLGTRRLGNNFQRVYRYARFHGEILDIDSRASDLNEGDERWVEVDIGTRDYEGRIREQKDAPSVVPNQESKNLQGPPNEGGVYSPTKKGSNYEPGHLLSPSQDGTDPPPARKYTGQEPEDLQVQPDEGNHSPEPALYHPGQRLDDLQSMEDGVDLRVQAESDRNREISTLDQTTLKEESDDLQDIINQIKNLRIS